MSPDLSVSVEVDKIVEWINEASDGLSFESPQGLARLGRRLESLSDVTEDEGWSRELAFMGMCLGVPGYGLIRERLLSDEDKKTLIALSKPNLGRLADATMKSNTAEVHSVLRDISTDYLRMV